MRDLKFQNVMVCNGITVEVMQQSGQLDHIHTLLQKCNAMHDHKGQMHIIHLIHSTALGRKRHDSNQGEITYLNISLVVCTMCMPSDDTCEN